MANNPHVTAAGRKLMLDALITLADAGRLRIYSGTQPAHADAAVAGTLLAELTMPTPAFTAGTATAGATYSVTAGAITQDSSADASGTATWFRLFRSDGTTPLLDGSAGVSGCDLNLSSDAISSGSIIQVTSMTLSFAA